RQRLRASPIDLIHAHYSYVGIVARTQWRVPVVVSYCGDDLLGTMNVRGKPTLFSRLAVFAGRLLSHQVDGVIVKSREMAEGLKRKKDVYVIPHEVDFELFRPMDREQARIALGLDLQKKYLLFAASPDIPVKRFPLAKEVADRLRRQNPEIELLVVHKEPQDRLPFYMNACDALVFPSYQEGSPNIVKQAMACNLPIVATDVGDVRKIIGSTAGCMISEPEVEAFAEVASSLLGRSQRTSGRQQVMHLDGANVARQIIDVYDSCFRRREH